MNGVAVLPTVISAMSENDLKDVRKQNGFGRRVRGRLRNHTVDRVSVARFSASLMAAVARACDVFLRVRLLRGELRRVSPSG